ncbi:MAG: DUF1684 domain-containing protein [Bacteroidia bacterium]|jgi:uncharacterized protein (DUF1684 family)
MRKSKYIILFLLLNAYLHSPAQNYARNINRERSTAKIELTQGDRAPLKSDELIYVKHFQPDSTWVLDGEVRFHTDTTSIPFATSSGKTKYFEKRAIIRFSRGKETFELTAYRNIQYRNKPELEFSLFIPFTDRSNGNTTYAGGRYLDISARDIKEDKIRIDFNLCYNPYCAYSAGYNCPVPPAENRLNIEIPVGEQAFSKPH